LPTIFRPHSDDRQGEHGLSKGAKDPVNAHDETYLLFVDLPSVDRSLQCSRADHGSLQLAMLAHHKTATSRGHATQKIPRANVAIRAP